jgi:D-alanyl-D-alanine dipeptidase
MTTPPSSDRPAAREYWKDQMEQAFAFMEKMRTFPVQECGERMISLREAVDGLKVEFSETKINDEHPRMWNVREGLGDSVRAIAKEMNDRGWTLKFEDGYRSPAMQRSLTHSAKIFDSILRAVMWELDGATPSPEFMLRRVGVLIATRCKVGTHISGSAIDISVIDQRSGREIPRGGPYIEISERTPMNSPFVTAEESHNRKEITALLRRQGWYAYPFEFWHYSRGDCYAEDIAGSGKPARYGPVVFAGGSITPVGPAAADALLEPVEFYRSQIAAALARHARQ